MTCEHKFHWKQINMKCDLADHHEGDHEGKYLGITSKITWMNGDRRDYVGDLLPCEDVSCILPGGHHGSHTY